VKYIPPIILYLRPYWKLTITTIIVTILVALAGLAAPWPLKILVDNVLGDQAPPPLLAVPLGALATDRFALLVFAVLSGLAIALLMNGLDVLNDYVQTKIGQGLVLDIRSALFQHIQRQSLAFHDQQGAGLYIFSINYEPEMTSGLILAILPLAQSGLTLIGMLWISLQIDSRLALLSLAVVPFLYYSVRYYITHIRERLLHMRELEGGELSILDEALSMQRVVVAFGREEYEYRRFRDLGERVRDARVRLTVRQTLFSLVVNMTTALGTALVLGFGASLALQRQLTVGQLLVVLAYIAAVYQPLETVSTSIGGLQDQLIAVQRAFRLLGKKVDITDAPGARPIARARGQLNFEGVHFSYSGRAETLKDIWLEIPAGQVVAIVGPTGAGKTTLVSLIPRFYDVSQGRVLLDGTDIRELTLKSLREQVSIVLQEPLLFSGSIADNIRYGKLDATTDQIIAAAKAANAHDFILRLPQQYATVLGERGAQLSGGERQRICIARAFLKDAPILILDEPTASVDLKTEAGILEALERLMLGRTTLLVAHRLSTIRHADQIVVLDRGQLVEQGSHEALLRRAGLYRQLYELQLGSAHSNGRAVGHASISAPK
jgi:ATP-binding cassette subfamily B protein